VILIAFTQPIDLDLDLDLDLDRDLDLDLDLDLCRQPKSLFIMGV
jgi:hypothetical protein